MRRWLKIVLWIIGSLLGLIALVLGLALWLLTPERLTPLVNQYATEYLNADVKFDRVDVSIFNDFPYLALSVIQGDVLSKALPDTRDTLLKFKRLDVSLNIWGLITMRGADIRRVHLSGARLRAIVDTAGNASWNIIRPSPESEDSTTFGFDLSRATIDKGFEIHFFDARDSTSFTAGFQNLTFEGSMGSDMSKLDIQKLATKNIGARGYIPSAGLKFRSLASVVSIDKLPRGGGYHLNFASETSATEHGDTLAMNLPVNLASTFDFNFATSKLINLRSTTFTVGKAQVRAVGSLNLSNDSLLQSNLHLALGAFSLSDAIGYIPPKMRGSLAKISTDLTVEFDSQIIGTYNISNGHLPHISASFSSSNGFLAYAGVKARIDNFAIQALATYNPDHIEKSTLALKKLEIEGSGINIKAQGSVSDYMRDPLIVGSFDGELDLGRMSLEFPSTRGIMASGLVAIHTRCDARLSNLNLDKLALTSIGGRLTFDDVKVHSPLDSVDFMGRGQLKFSSSKNKADSTIQRGLAVLGVSLTLDTLHFKMGSSLAANSKALNIRAMTGAARYADSTHKKIHPFHGTVSANRLTLNGLDSAQMQMLGLDVDFRVDPSPTNITIPHLTTTIRTDQASARAGKDRYRMAGATFHFSSTIFTKEQDSVLRRTQMLDLLQKRYPTVERKNLMLYSRMMRSVGIAKKDDLVSGDLDLKMSDDVVSILRRWHSNGTMKVDSLSFVTPYLPLRSSLTGLDFAFNNDSIALDRSTIQLGRSDIKVTGKIGNITRALSGRGNLLLRLKVTGDTLDLNELVVALNAGFSSADRVEQMITAQTTQDQAAAIIATQTAIQDTNRLIIVPKNIDLVMDLDVARAYYGNVRMNALHGELIARNRILQINDLRAQSSIGAMEFNAVYATRSKQDITTGFDIVLGGVDVAALIDLLPEVDTLLPMLASFEGKLDCKLAATASLDSTMTILIPTLNAAGSIYGQDMVLLDGETFTEISKILRFKNRARNRVDKISVEMLVRNSAIEIFPFILELDRYKAAVSGIQKLDMSFDYHISVLKSIIPFRLGVDIYGTTDDWKFRVTKARYKSEKIPSYSALIDTTRIDLRRAITDIFTTGVKNLVLHQTDVVAHADSSSLRVIDSLDTAGDDL
ncbi:MAG: AsmA-like C-terminal region-containing protein [Mucinivorans sp.]